MKTSKKYFSIIFCIIYLLYAGAAFFNGLPKVIEAVKLRFPNASWLTYEVNTAGKAAMPLQSELLEQHASILNLLGKQESGGFEIITGVDGAFIKNVKNDWNRTEVEQKAIKLYELKQDLEEEKQDTEIMFISPVPQVAEDHTRVVNNFPIYDQNNLMETFLYDLTSYNIPFLNSSSILKRSSLDASEYVYKTDTKLTTLSSFMIYQGLIGELNYKYDELLDPSGELTDLDSFSSEVYEDIFMGSLTAQAGVSFTGKEDFTAVLPEFETNLTYEAFGYGNVKVNGSFEEVLFYDKFLDPQQAYSDSVYSAYMEGGRYFQRKITNQNIQNDVKVLFIHDASALPLISFMSLAVEEVHAYWPEAASQGQEFDVLEYVKENDIDYVFFTSENYYYSLDGLFN